MKHGSDDRPGARPAPEVHVALSCEAPGCGWRGSAGSNGRFACIAHLGQEPQDWSAITNRTADLFWFARFIGDVQRMSNFPRKGEETWLSYAHSFWEKSDPSMQPTEPERRDPALYLYRMFDELRAMALGKERPAAHVPQGLQRDWQPRDHVLSSGVSS